MNTAISSSLSSLEMLFESPGITRDLILKDFQESDLRFKSNEIDKYFLIDNYYKDRLSKRDKSKNWPDKLSKKELIICKLTMLKTLLSLLGDASGAPLKPGEHLIVDILQSMIKIIEKDVYKVPVMEPGTYFKYPGLPKDIAEFLNELYKSLIKIYQKKSAN